MNKDYVDPIDYFSVWYEQAQQNPHIEEANAVNLATASPEGLPTSRMVLLKDFDENGFVFYTNLESRKGQQLKANPQAAMNFYWEPLARQMRIEGQIVPVTQAQADEYFASRAFKSKIGAWASKQSQPLQNQATLLKAVTKLAVKYASGSVPRPPFWSGFRLMPSRMEFWQRGEYRLHRRQCYTLDAQGQWQMQLLYP